MAKQDKSKLKDWFTTGKYPTQEQFWDWMDSYIHRDDQLRITANFPELDGVLQQKVDKEVFKHHFENDNNPHNVTKQQVGLGSVDNTMDIDKPVSMATQTALDLKADKTAMADHLKDDQNPHKVTKQQVGLGKADNTADLDKPVSRETQTALYLKADRADLNRHLMNDTNPHQVTKAQVGLGHVDDTADVNKPISTATQTALDLKADKTNLSNHLIDTTNPHRVTKAQVGLGNVDDTTDVNKPISTATQTALDLKADKTYVNEQVTSLVNGAPELLDTLKELSAAIGDDANFASTLSKQLGNKLDKTEPLTNLVVSSGTDPITTTDKLIEALGKLQGQINMLSRFNKRVFVEPNSLRNQLSNVVANTSKTVETSVMNTHSFSNQNGINKLTLMVNLLNSATPTANSDFERKYEFYLSLKNGKLSTMYSDAKPYTDIKIGEIVNSKGHGTGNGIKTMELYFKTSMQSDPLASIQWSMLEFTPFQIQNNIRTEGTPVSVYLRDMDNTKIIGASECLFTLKVKSSILFKKGTNPTIADAGIDINGVILDRIK